MTDLLTCTVGWAAARGLKWERSEEEQMMEEEAIIGGLGTWWFDVLVGSPGEDGDVK